MLYGDKNRYPKIKMGACIHPEDAIGPRLALAAAAANMLLALDWVSGNGYAKSDDEDEITPFGLGHMISRMLVEIDTLRDMARDIDAERRRATKLAEVR